MVSITLRYFTPVANFSISYDFFLLISREVQYLEIEQMDVKSAFLARDLNKIIYMEQPEGFTLMTEPYVLSFSRRAYVALNSHHINWNKKIHHFLIVIGFHTNKF